MKIKRIQDADVKNKKVLLRVDFNVSIENGDVKEKFKLRAAKKSVEYLLKKNCKIALLSHLGRPEGRENSKFSFSQLKDDVKEILGIKIKFISDCVGEKVSRELDNLREEEVLLLENVRFYEGDEAKDEEFAKKLADDFEIFVFDAFGVCHRDHASTTGINKFLPSFGGFWLQKEIENLDKIKNNPEHPAVAIIGGAKVETKIPLIKIFEEKYDNILIGGKIANEIIDQKIEFGEKIILPVDFGNNRLDIGPETIDNFKIIIAKAETIVWNGPMGKFEEPEYMTGTKEILNAILGSKAYSLAGGGESVEILEKEGAMDKISFVSTGGGAMLEYLSGNPMPGIEALEE